MTLSGENGGAERTPPTLSVVIPMYRESRRLPQSLPGLCQWLARWSETSEILAVDDGSRDGTGDVATRIFAEAQGGKCRTAQVLTHAHNRGKGEAVRTGFRKSRGQWILLSDADQSAPIWEVEKLLRTARDLNAGLVLGSREAPGADVVCVWSRRLLGRLFQKCVIWCGLPRVADSQCGFKLYRRDVAMMLAEKMTESGYAMDLEQILLAIRSGSRVVEVGITWHHVSGGQVHPLRDGLAMLSSVVRLRLRYGPERRGTA